MAESFIDRSVNIRELTELLLSTESFEQYAQQVVDLAANRILPGASCGLTIRRDGRAMTAASSDELASRVDEAQYGVGQGPCLEAMDTATVILVSDLATEERWGDYRLHALAQGVRASLSLPIVTQNGSAGALNLYATAPGAFTMQDVERGSHFADQAAGALALAVRLAEQTSLTAHLQTAMTSRSVIDHAIGIIMAQNRCQADVAFDLLRKASQSRNVKLRQVATDIVTAVGGAPPVPGPTIAPPRPPRSDAQSAS